MKILILGGTIFVGRHLVHVALERGHEVTLFNRGRHNPSLFSKVEKLRGDRMTSDLEALQGRKWDAVIDTCGYVPRVVRESTELLADHVEHYTFISTISVYRDWNTSNMDETAPLATIEDETTESVTGETYGPLKALCEQTAEKAMPERVLTIRPGLIVGPDDLTDRFTYWVDRVSRGGEILAPGRPERLVQIIDVRDLAEWNIRMVEAKQTGIYNAVGPKYPLTMETILDECRTVTQSEASLIWVDEAFLHEQQVAPYSEMPLWIPETDDTIDFKKAILAGLTLRPLKDTIQDTYDWNANYPRDKWRAGITSEREIELLNLYRSKSI